MVQWSVASCQHRILSLRPFGDPVGGCPLSSCFLPFKSGSSASFQSPVGTAACSLGREPQESGHPPIWSPRGAASSRLCRRLQLPGDGTASTRLHLFFPDDSWGWHPRLNASAPFRGCDTPDVRAPGLILNPDFHHPPELGIGAVGIAVQRPQQRLQDQRHQRQKRIDLVLGVPRMRLAQVLQRSEPTDQPQPDVVGDLALQLSCNLLDLLVGRIVPGAEDWLAREELGPLSTAQTRKPGAAPAFPPWPSACANRPKSKESTPPQPTPRFRPLLSIL